MTRGAMTRGKKIAWGIGGIALIVAFGMAARAASGVLLSASEEIPTATVTRGTLKADLVTTGEIKATKTDMLVVPPTGAALRILTLLPSGTPVKKGETVVTFDPTDQEQTVEEQRSVLREAQLEIARTLATSTHARRRTTSICRPRASTCGRRSSTSRRARCARRSKRARRN